MTYVEPTRANPFRPARPTAALRDGRGPERVDVGSPDADFVRKPVGFTANLGPVDEPLLWEGDSA